MTLATQIDFLALDAVEKHATYNGLLPTLSVLTTVNATRGECICASQADVNGIVKLINREQAVKFFRNEISNEGYDDGDDNEDDGALILFSMTNY